MKKYPQTMSTKTIEELKALFKGTELTLFDRSGTSPYKYCTLHYNTNMVWFDSTEEVNFSYVEGQDNVVTSDPYDEMILPHSAYRFIVTGDDYIGETRYGTLIELYNSDTKKYTMQAIFNATGISLPLHFVFSEVVS